MTQSSIRRFSSRVTDYVNTRPGYPLEILDLLAFYCDLTPESIIADIGSGSGLISKLFLDNGNTVVGVEPNADMRSAGENYLSDYARFKSIDGKSEATGLPAESMDMVVAAQAFHWFDVRKTRAEFLRILKPAGFCVLVWNNRRTASSAFLCDYEALLQTYPEYRVVNLKRELARATFEEFYGGQYQQATLENAQHFDLPGLISHAASASYVPGRGTKEFTAFEKKLAVLFKQHVENSRVTFEYDTLVYWGIMR